MTTTVTRRRTVRPVGLIPIKRPRTEPRPLPTETAYIQPHLALDFRPNCRDRASSEGTQSAPMTNRADPSLDQSQGPPETNRRTPARFGRAGDQDDPYFDRQPTGDDNLPDPRPWAARLSQAVVEVRAGSRPLHQLMRWTSPDVYEALATTVHATGSSPLLDGTVSSVRVGRPADGVAEVSAVVAGRRRSRALAFRLEGWDGRWLCTTLTVL